MAYDDNINFDWLGWYHPSISRTVAETLLLVKGDGAYLVRNSSRHGQFTLSVRSKSCVNHFELLCSPQEIKFGAVSFSNRREMLQYFCQKPVIENSAGERILLTYPIMRFKDVDDYERIVRQTKPRNNSTESDLSKEGYLEKLGDVVKNWKRRWCVLSNRTLKYYRDGDRDKKPHRILDLTECTECCVDVTRGRDLCFRVVMPWRTFFFCASTSGDMRTWIQAINKHLPEKKEGWMTKQGGVHKSWKKRWFTLDNFTLKYFKSKDDKEPIKTLDLNECSECSADISQKKDNCFKVVLPWRTFYFFCKSFEETQVWMRAINDKLRLIQENKAYTSSNAPPVFQGQAPFGS